MNRYLVATLFVLTLAPYARADNPKDRWLGSVDSALAAAKKFSKPVFLTFRCER